MLSVTMSAENGAPFTTLASTGRRKFKAVVTPSFSTSLATPSCHPIVKFGSTSCAETGTDANETHATSVAGDDDVLRTHVNPQGPAKAGHYVRITRYESLNQSNRAREAVLPDENLRLHHTNFRRNVDPYQFAALERRPGRRAGPGDELR